MRFRVQLVRAALAFAICTGAASGADPRIAILDSANTKEFFARHYGACNPAAGIYYLGAEEYQRYFRGWEFVLGEMGYRAYTTIIDDDDVTEKNLSNYDLLILSNTASLSGDQQKAIRQWVIRGGRLLATFGSGYKTTDTDARQDDELKMAEGGTLGLHQLWHDPVTKTFGSNPVNNGAGTDVRITRYEGPTKDLEGQLPDNLLDYGAESNLLVQRPEDQKDVLALVVLKEVDNHRPLPAIISTRLSRGLVVYFAFAPEYLVSKEFNLPIDHVCLDSGLWGGRSTEARKLMESTVNYLLGR